MANVCAVRTIKDNQAYMRYSFVAVSDWLPHEPESEERYALVQVGGVYVEGAKDKTSAVRKHCGSVYRTEDR